MAKQDSAGQKGVDIDTALDAAALGVGPTSDDAEVVLDDEVLDNDDILDNDERSEVDVMGVAAGVVIPDDEPLGGRDEIAKRDAHRWELDPASAEDLETREDTITEPVRVFRDHAQSSSGER